MAKHAARLKGTIDMNEQEADVKIGAGHASAMFRQGLSELRAALYTDSNVAQPPQAGMYGTRTQGEVMQERGTYGGGSHEEPSSVLQERIQQVEKEAPQHEPPEPDRE